MANLDRFVADRQPTWSTLSELVRRAGKRPDRLGEQDLRELGRTYRSAAADLATARRRFPGDPVVVRLEALVGAGRGLVHRDTGRSFTLRSFVTRDYWRLVAERPALIGLGWMFTAVPAVLMFIWCLRDPARAASLLPKQYVGGGRTSYNDLGLSGGEQTAMATYIFTNNIRVSFLAFASGITAGIGTAYLLIFNGLLLGGVAGLATRSGHGDTVFTLIVAHGVLELSIIVVAAAAGMRIGWALVDPGLEPRSKALVKQARSAVLIVIGTIPWFVLAGLVEGFVTPAGFGPLIAGIVGVSLGSLYWGLVLWRGRAPVRPAQAPLAPAPLEMVRSPLTT